MKCIKEASAEQEQEFPCDIWTCFNAARNAKYRGDDWIAPITTQYIDLQSHGSSTERVFGLTITSEWRVVEIIEPSVLREQVTFKPFSRVDISQILEKTPRGTKSACSVTIYRMESLINRILYRFLKKLLYSQASAEDMVREWQSVWTSHLEPLCDSKMRFNKSQDDVDPLSDWSI